MTEGLFSTLLVTGLAGRRADARDMAIISLKIFGIRRPLKLGCFGRRSRLAFGCQNLATVGREAKPADPDGFQGVAVGGNNVVKGGLCRRGGGWGRA